MPRLVSTTEGIGVLLGDRIALLEVSYRDLGEALSSGADLHELASAERRAIRELQYVTLTAPLPAPSKIWAVGWSYRSHAEESGRAVEEPPDPFFFLKAPSAVTAPRQAIRLPAIAPDRVDYEGELAVVIGRKTSNASRAQARAAIAAYTIANDVSARDVQKGELEGRMPNINLAKSFDTFAPMGPCLVTLDEFSDPDDLLLTTQVDGVERQHARTNGLMYDVSSQVAYVSHYTTLAPGDVILTGTPAGVGYPERFLRDGSVVRIEIEGIGVLENPVVREAPSVSEEARAQTLA